ncbi:hypothetical protein PTKIN_Ptkin02bG0148000 [Pterospermum kingtungense]
MDEMLVWMRFPCLPIEYYDREFLLKVGSKIGHPIRVDHATSLVSKGKFSRLCVEEECRSLKEDDNQNGTSTDNENVVIDAVANGNGQ